MMLKLKINNKVINVTEGISVLAAARISGDEIPTMCYREGKPHFTSCMICMVKDAKTGKLFPSCSVKALDGMQIITMDEEIEESRRMALELLLSEHVGDCEAPCQITCPAHMDIPLMNRLLAEGKINEALRVVKKDIPLPAVFGRICPAPCEGACRRKSVDSPVSICLLKRYAGDNDLLEENTYIPERKTSSGKKVAIIGAGPAGLAAAYYLQLKGHQCDNFDRRSKPGGKLWTEVEKGILPVEVLEKEIGILSSLGVNFNQGVRIDNSNFQKIAKDYDAILIASGNSELGIVAGLEMSEKGIHAERDTYRTSNSKIFAAGSAVRSSKLAIRTLGQGKGASFSIDQFLSGMPVNGEPFIFNSRFGKLLPEEITEYLKESVIRDRIQPVHFDQGFSIEELKAEAERCMHCDCREITNCKLRSLSDEYKANQKHYWSEERIAVKKQHFGKFSDNSVGSIVHSEEQLQDVFVIYERNKCIKCGICVRITEEYKEKFGMSFIGRGFDVVVGVPFNESLASGLALVAKEVVKGCPTGALAKKE